MTDHYPGSCPPGQHCCLCSEEVLKQQLAAAESLNDIRWKESVRATGKIGWLERRLAEAEALLRETEQQRAEACAREEEMFQRLAASEAEHVACDAASKRQRDAMDELYLKLAAAEKLIGWYRKNEHGTECACK